MVLDTGMQSNGIARRETMKDQTFGTLPSFFRRWVRDMGRGIDLGNRMAFFWGRIKVPQKAPVENFLSPRCMGEEEKRWPQAVISYLTGKILVDQGVINSVQLTEALKGQRELQEKGRRKSLGVRLVEMGYTTSNAYLDALSQYFGLRIISFLKFIPLPGLQGLWADRFVQNNKLLILADYGTKVMLTLAEPDPLILEELKKPFGPWEKMDFHLADPFEMERCFQFHYGSQNS
jgi:hypothetical protein